MAGMADCIRGWLKDLAPIVVSIAVLVVTLLFNGWQRRLAKQQLRYQLYERRMAIYGAFRELLLALPEKEDDEIQALFRKASIARSEAPFLFEDDAKLQTYLENLCNRIGAEVYANIVSMEAFRRAGVPPDIQTGQKAAQLATAKLEIPGDHLPELPKQFAPFLSLTDFSARRSPSQKG